MVEFTASTAIEPGDGLVAVSSSPSRERVRNSFSDERLYRVPFTDRLAIVHVKSNGVPPQMFRVGIGVVVEGTMTRGGYFQSDRLMVSHNNEYRAPKAGEQIDTKKLIKSTKGVE